MLYMPVHVLSEQSEETQEKLSHELGGVKRVVKGILGATVVAELVVAVMLGGLPQTSSRNHFGPRAERR